MRHSFLDAAKRILRNAKFTIQLSFFATLSIHPVFSSEDSSDEFDPVVLFVSHPKIGEIEIQGLIQKEVLFLSPQDVFAFFHIKVGNSSPHSLTGFLLDPSDLYEIDFLKRTIRYKGLDNTLPEDSILEFEGKFYLNSTLYGQYFGISCQFDIRNLTIQTQADLNLPVFKNIQRELLRKRINGGREMEADTTIRSGYTFLSFDGLDWNIFLNKGFGIAKSENAAPSDQSIPSRGGISMGGNLAWGRVQARLTWLGQSKLNYRNVDVQWKKVFESQSFIKQITVGRINGSTFSTLFYPITGVSVTNAPPVTRKAFGTHLIQDVTQPYWTVELVVNNQLVDFVKTDESGFYRFEVPLNYGNNRLEIRFFGLNGEEQIRDESVFVPFVLLPHKSLVYQANAGIIHGTRSDQLGNFQLSYGLTQFLTFGAGIEYNSGLLQMPIIPRLTSSIKLGNGVFLSSEWMPGLKTSSVITARTNSGLTLDLSVENLQKGQKVYPQFTYLSQRRLTASLPFHLGGKRFNSRINLTELIYPSLKTQVFQSSFYGNVLGAFTSLSLNLNRFGESKFLNAIMQQSYRISSTWSYNHRVQLNVSQLQQSNLMLGLEKVFSNRFRLSTFFQTDYSLSKTLTGLSLKFDMGVFQGTSNSRLIGDEVLLNQLLMGSVAYDMENKDFRFTSSPNANQASLTLLPFLDLNSNQLKEDHEPYEHSLSATVQGASTSRDPQSGRLSVKNLIPFQSYKIILDEGSLQDISWRLPFSTVEFSIKPGVSNKLLVPINIVHELEGKVLVDSIPKEGVRINLFDSNKNLIRTVLTRKDGNYFISDLAAGNYLIRPDSLQLKEITGSEEVPMISISLKESEFGEFLSDQNFHFYRLTSMADSMVSAAHDLSDSIKPEFQPTKEILLNENPDGSLVTPSTLAYSRKDLPELDSSIQEESNSNRMVIYRIQLLASKDSLSESELKRMPKDLVVSQEMGWVKYFTGQWASFQEAEMARKKLEGAFPKAFIVYQVKDKDFSSVHLKDKPLKGVEGMYFRIQVFASVVPLPPSFYVLRLVPDLELEVHEGMYKYVTPIFLHDRETKLKLKELRELGISDSFVVRYLDGKRILP